MELLKAFINVFRSVGQLKDVCVSEEDRTSSGQVWDGRNDEKPVPASSDANIAFAKHLFATHTALQHLKTTSVNYWWAPQYKTKPLSLERPEGLGFFLCRLKWSLNAKCVLPVV